MTGITRVEYEKSANGWWIRLGYKNRKPQYQKSILDSWYKGNKKKSLKAALKWRDKKRDELHEQGVLNKYSHPQSKPFRMSKGPKKTKGVAGVRKKKILNKSGTCYFQWEVSWSEIAQGGKPRRKAFGFTTYNGEYGAFEAAVKYRHDKELELYGYTLIDLEKTREYHLQYSKLSS